MPTKQVCYIPLLAFILLPLVVVAVPIPLAQSFHPQTKKRSDPVSSTSYEVCGFQGDSDTYGLGIRLSIYINWFTYSLACFIKQNELRPMRLLTNSFQVAMIIALVFLTKSRGNEFYASEAYIITTLCIGNALVDGLYPNFPINDHRYPKTVSALGLLVGLFTDFSLYLYLTWFFFTGMDKMKHDVCTTTGYFFAAVNLYGWFRTLMKVLSVYYLASYSFFFLEVVVVKTVPSLGKMWDKFKSEIWGNYDPEQASKMMAQIRGVLVGITRAQVILAIELLIKWNHVRGISSLGSTGQLLPLVISILGLLTLLYSVYGKEEEDTNPEGSIRANDSTEDNKEANVQTSEGDDH